MSKGLAVILIGILASPVWAAFTLSSAKSRVVHGTAGTFDRTLNPGGVAVSEGRKENRSVLLTFSRALRPGDNSWDGDEITSDIANAITSITHLTAPDDASILVGISDGIPNKSLMTLTVKTGTEGIVALDNGESLSGVTTVSVSYLWGDQNADGYANWKDEWVIYSHIGHQLSTYWFCDINADGVLSAADQAILTSNYFYIKTVSSYREHGNGKGLKGIEVWNGATAAQATGSEPRYRGGQDGEIEQLWIAFSAPIKFANGSYSPDMITNISAGNKANTSASIEETSLRIAAFSGVPAFTCLSVVLDMGASGIVPDDSLTSLTFADFQGPNAFTVRVLPGDVEQYTFAGGCDKRTDIYDWMRIAQNPYIYTAKYDLNLDGIENDSCPDAQLIIDNNWLDTMVDPVCPPF